MTSRTSPVVLAAAVAVGVLGLAACETGYAPASTATADRPLNPDCRPGATPAGTRSGLACDTGSSTGAPSGSDANVEGAGSAGSAPAVPGHN
jgi:hypothetical protein